MSLLNSGSIAVRAGCHFCFLLDDGDDEMCVTALSVANGSTSRACGWKLGVCERKVQGPGMLLMIAPLCRTQVLEILGVEVLRISP